MGIKWSWGKKKPTKIISLVLLEFTIEEETKVEQVITKLVQNYICVQRCCEEQHGP